MEGGEGHGWKGKTGRIVLKKKKKLRRQPRERRGGDDNDKGGATLTHGQKNKVEVEAPAHEKKRKKGRDGHERLVWGKDL